MLGSIHTLNVLSDVPSFFITKCITPYPFALHNKRVPTVPRLALYGHDTNDMKGPLNYSKVKH